ncbi:MAG: cation transporter [Erysipelotrichaceae bacterium]|nr:cation transporter [Erysipelotrichaceae bacterium]
MKKSFKIEVDCANCAARVENIIKEIEGVEDATVSFMTQKLSIKAPEEKMAGIIEEAIKRVAKADPDTVIYVK